MTTPEEFLKANGFVSASEIDSQSLIGAFISEMEKGLAGEESSLRMIPAYVGVNGRIPQGAKAAVLDAGGTNFRTALLRFEDEGYSLEGLKKQPMPGIAQPCTWDEFVSFVADNV